METENLALLSEDDLRSKIHTIRGVQVMLDFDLAAIYGYETRRFNEQVKNNIDRFDDTFRFQLTDFEFKNLMSKISTSSWGGTRKLPYAFTEEGIYMLMTVLKGNLAASQSKKLIKLFKQMKDFIIRNQNVLSGSELVKLSMQTHSNTEEIRQIRQQMVTHDELAVVPPKTAASGSPPSPASKMCCSTKTSLQACGTIRTYNCEQHLKT